MKVGFVSLGCSKNLIDTEIAIGHFKNNNYEIENNPEKAEIIVINTCGFIETAKEEAISTILEMAEYKDKKCQYLIVMGCLVQRYYEELIKCLPEVDLFIKIEEYDKLWQKIEMLIKEGKTEKNATKASKKISEIKALPMPTSKEFYERVITTGENFAYLKIGEGCSNRCTYCAIPYIRGPFVSRKMEDIIEEAKRLSEKGIREIIIIAQDTTKYGVDIYGESKLAELLQKLSEIPEIRWIRFLYSYPEGITDKLIQVVKNNEKICKYFDIPIQHISDKILKKMNRRTNKKHIEQLIDKIRKEIPEATLRTSLIVGFPGEEQEDFDELCEFVEKAKFDKLGAFMYSKEEGTPAERLPNQIHKNTKKSRYNKIMKIQQQISKRNLKEIINKQYEVIVEEITFDGKYLIGRTKQDVPEIDGLVYIKNENKKKLLNKFVKIKVIDVNDYDLIGELIEN
ncbi:MAG: 30S ribosomal protein S12 methylthiotransferase RimO [Clostridia bacterium]|nr:30S ribosomal protein S12 methylthiotransferase RimO [Clostridia bacterium]